MQKPILRWTIGSNVLPIAYEVLEQSIKNALKVFGQDAFDYYVLYNLKNNDSFLNELKRIENWYPVNLIRQTWEQFPLPIVEPIKVEKQLENHARFMGSVWKLCPDRLNINTHEIIIDSDVIFTKKIDEIDDFLNSDKILAYSDCYRFYGKYDHIIDSQHCCNSGIIGLPPNYKFGESLFKTWDENKRHPFLAYNDEQGLVIATLAKEENIMIPNYKIPILHPEKFSNKNLSSDKEPEFADYDNFDYDKFSGFHFVEVNRREHYGYNLWNAKQNTCRKLHL